MQIESQRRYRRFLIVLVYLIEAMVGITLGIYSEPGTREALYSISLAFVLTQICIVDSRIVGKPLPPNSYWIILMLSPLSVAICIIRGRGVAGAGILAAHFVGVVLVLNLFMVVASLLVHGTIFPFF
jgi:hypothetical protein